MWRHYHNEEHCKSVSNIFFFKPAALIKFSFPIFGWKGYLLHTRISLKELLHHIKPYTLCSINKQTIIKGCLWNQNAWWKIAIMDTKTNDSPRGLWCKKKIVNCVLLPPVPSYCRIYQPLWQTISKNTGIVTLKCYLYHISTQIFKHLKE